ncbi:MAG: c-type cytochrome [Sulfurimonas sp.]|nr:c-type cytochrome [Sulfurimonas sp.]
MKNKKLTFLILTVLLLSIIPLQAFSTSSEWLRPNGVPQPKDNRLTLQRVELGKLLFFDKRLSKSEEISCASCHNPELGWSDAEPKAIGHEGKVGPRNSPTILNTAYQTHQFWDGRVETLEEQALGPIEADVEMNMPLKELIPKLRKIQGYKILFDKAYPGLGITKDTLAKAIASFERTIVSTEAPFDRYIKGNKKAISKNAQDGFELFKDKGRCTDCHSGYNFSDGSFHNLGLKDGDKGRIEVRKGIEKATGAFKTPTLRDITKSGPYFHDGSVKTIHEATAICGNGGRFSDAKGLSLFMIDRDLTIDDIEKIVTFLRTLEGEPMKLKIPTKFPQ